MAYRATLTSMAENGVNYPILCYVSGGIYSGNINGKTTVTNKQIRAQTPKIITDILKELGNHPFVKVFLCG